MHAKLRLTTEADASIIKNLWPLYVHEVSEFGGAMPNRHGVVGVGDDVRTLAEQGETQSGWWARPTSLFPYLILADDRPAGFNLIAGRASLPEGIDADSVVHEFFVLHPFRGHGIGERAAIEGFDRHRGRWEVVTYPTHRRAIAFWRRVLGAYTVDRYEEREVDHPWGRKIVFTFDNSAPGATGA